MKTGELIKLLRKQKRFTQAQLANLANITQQYLCDIEKGNRTPNPELIDKLSKHLGYRFEMYRLAGRIPVEDQEEFFQYFSRKENRNGQICKWT